MTTQAKSLPKSMAQRLALGRGRKRGAKPSGSRKAETKLAVRTADAIERRIVENRLQPDSHIGSEAQLLEEYDVSRAVLREAIKEKGLLVDLETRLNAEVGRRIRERRHAQPLTLKQLANRTGLSVSLISQIELGKSAASMSTLHKLATALGTKMTYFFETV